MTFCFMQGVSPALVVGDGSHKQLLADDHDDGQQVFVEDASCIPSKDPHPLGHPLDEFSRLRQQAMAGVSSYSLREPEISVYAFGASYFRAEETSFHAFVSTELFFAGLGGRQWQVCFYSQRSGDSWFSAR